jgi:CelD/BcsL family acetyltransferase involved in cellulose biosynthesis
MGSHVTGFFQLNPLKDPRWGEFVERHARASVFHSVGWLEALRRTYGYSPVGFTTSSPGEKLKNGMVFCEVESWLTGRRLVSLPFSDHCEPLVEAGEDYQVLLAGLQDRLRADGWRYIEIRPVSTIHSDTSKFRASNTYCFHQLDLNSDLDKLFSNFNKDSTQRKIRRAERENLTIEEGRSEFLLDAFYHLQLLTRQRHGLPPQPKTWYRNLVDCLGDALTIRVALKGKQAVAAIITLRSNDALIYKYGCSDIQFNNMGGTQLLFWRSIQEAKNSNLHWFDLGRSDEDNSGLITFKDRWGTQRSTLTYLRYPAMPRTERDSTWKMQIAKRVFAHTPNAFLSSIGGILYRHMG